MSRSFFLLDNKYPDQVKAKADINNKGIDIDKYLVPTTIRKVIDGNVIISRSIVEHVHSNLKMGTKTYFNITNLQSL